MKLKDVYKLIIWDILNPFPLKIKKYKKYKFDSSFAGINLGGGIDNPPAWLDIDGGATHFLVKKLPKFMEIFPEFRGRRLFGGMGALVVKEDVSRYAEKAGLYVLTQTSEGGAALINRKNFRAKEFS